MDNRSEIIEARIDLAAAFRMAARLQMHEGVCNHFSMALPDGMLAGRECAGPSQKAKDAERKGHASKSYGLTVARGCPPHCVERPRIEGSSPLFGLGRSYALVPSPHLDRWR